MSTDRVVIDFEGRSKELEADVDRIHAKIKAMAASAAKVSPALAGMGASVGLSSAGNIAAGLSGLARTPGPAARMREKARILGAEGSALLQTEAEALADLSTVATDNTIRQVEARSTARRAEWGGTKKELLPLSTADRQAQKEVHLARGAAAAQVSKAQVDAAEGRAKAQVGAARQKAEVRDASVAHAERIRTDAYTERLNKKEELYQQHKAEREERAKAAAAAREANRDPFSFSPGGWARRSVTSLLGQGTGQGWGAWASHHILGQRQQVPMGPAPMVPGSAPAYMRGLMSGPVTQGLNSVNQVPIYAVNGQNAQMAQYAANMAGGYAQPGPVPMGPAPVPKVTGGMALQAAAVAYGAYRIGAWGLGKVSGVLGEESERIYNMEQMQRGAMLRGGRRTPVEFLESSDTAAAANRYGLNPLDYLRHNTEYELSRGRGGAMRGEDRREILRTAALGLSPETAGVFSRRGDGYAAQHGLLVQGMRQLGMGGDALSGALAGAAKVEDFRQGIGASVFSGGAHSGVMQAMVRAGASAQQASGAALNIAGMDPTADFRAQGQQMAKMAVLAEAFKGPGTFAEKLDRADNSDTAERVRAMQKYGVAGEYMLRASGMNSAQAGRLQGESLIPTSVDLDDIPGGKNPLSRQRAGSQLYRDKMSAHEDSTGAAWFHLAEDMKNLTDTFAESVSLFSRAVDGMTDKGAVPWMM